MRKVDIGGTELLSSPVALTLCWNSEFAPNTTPFFVLVLIY